MMHTIHYRFENRDKQRYYKVYLSKDLFCDWVITKAWGSLNNASGRIVHEKCLSFEAGVEYIKKITKIRKQHGYAVCETLAD